jgi:DUF1680 family protein
MNFKKAAGLVPGTFLGMGFFDGDVYKWLEAAIAVLSEGEDEKLSRQVKELIDIIGRIQLPSGYIFTKYSIDFLNGDVNARPFREGMDFEMYNFGHLISAAILQYKTSGEVALLHIAEKICDFLAETFRNPNREIARFDICPSHYMGIVEMYRITGRIEYLKLVETLIDVRNLISHGSDMNQERIPFRQQTEVVGHAVRANYLYAGVADLYGENGDESLRIALDNLWGNLSSKKLYITGATGALDTGTSPSTYGNYIYYEKLAKGDSLDDINIDPKETEIQVVQQAYGRAYQLPNLTSYNESCATIGSALWNWRMFLLDGDVQYMDMFEHTMLNGILSTVSLDGNRFFYRNSLRRNTEAPFPLRYSSTRQTEIKDYCCPPNITRTIAESSDYSYCISGDTIWTGLYGQSICHSQFDTGESIEIQQKTDYPMNGRIEFKFLLSSEKEFSFNLRIPKWCRSASYTIVDDSGIILESQENVNGGKYHTIRRIWDHGDNIQIDLPMDTRIIKGHHLIEEVRGQGCLMRGPLVYCLEAVDIAGDVRNHEVLLDVGQKIVERKIEIAGCEMICLDTSLRYMKDQDHNNLYYQTDDMTFGKVDVSFIPYFAWDNRGDGDMDIWLPLSWGI